LNHLDDHAFKKTDSHIKKNGFTHWADETRAAIFSQSKSHRCERKLHFNDKTKAVTASPMPISGTGHNRNSEFDCRQVAANGIDGR